MIIRLWIYRTLVEHAERFEEFERRVGLPMVKGQPGCLSVELLRLRPTTGDDQKEVEYNMLSRWESAEAMLTARNSQAWKDEVALFIAQGFGEGNGETKHFEQLELVQ
ncbi:MAG TPA: antibiotic biosynthesis monooxygenase family protein [Chloroflexia bacterium]|nr:antibiotic biosynthesis monooxygenase family protein [Chloroflexia bacterium]